MKKWIAFLKLEGFYARAHQPEGGWYGPTVVAHGGRVLEACAAAQAEGVAVGAPLAQVRSLCPRAQVAAFDNDRCLPLYRQVWDLVAEHSPAVEPLQLHYGFAELSSVVANVAQARKWQQRLGDRLLQQTGLRAAIGIGSRRFVARVAALHDAVVAAADVRRFLAPVPPAELDWLDGRLREGLQKLGLHSLGQVAAMDRNTLIEQTGPEGGQLRDWLDGKSESPIQALYPPPEQRVGMVFEFELDQALVIASLGRLCGQLADRLQQCRQRPCRLALGLETDAGMQAVDRQYSRPLQDASRLEAAAQSLLEQLWQGGLLHGMELAAGDLQPVEARQMELWNSHRRAQVEQAVEAARNRHGCRALIRASELRSRRRFAQAVLAAEGRFCW